MSKSLNLLKIPFIASFPVSFSHRCLRLLSKFTTNLFTFGILRWLPRFRAINKVSIFPFFVFFFFFLHSSHLSAAHEKRELHKSRTNNCKKCFDCVQNENFLARFQMPPSAPVCVRSWLCVFAYWGNTYFLPYFFILVSGKQVQRQQAKGQRALRTFHGKVQWKFQSGKAKPKLKLRPKCDMHNELRCQQGQLFYG